MKISTVAFGYIIKILILYCPTVERLKLYVENLNMLIANYLFYSEENDRIISKIISYSVPKYIEFSINTRTFTKTINKI
jgi:hypothetical protein